MNFIIFFALITLANVIIQTVKSLFTIKGGKLSAATVNAIAFGFYTYIIIITNCELPVLQKCIIVAICNLIGVFIVKYIEKKSQKDKLWKVEMTIPEEKSKFVHEYLTMKNIPHNDSENVGKYTIFNCYCSTQEQSIKVKNILEKVGGKYFASESKIL